MSNQIYMAICHQCQKELWDMMKEPMADHIGLDITVNKKSYISQEQKRFCDYSCLRQWTDKK